MKLRCFVFAAILAFSSATAAVGGEIQFPGRSEPSPTPPPTALITPSTSGGPTQAMSTEELQIVWLDTTSMLVELLLTIF